MNVKLTIEERINRLKEHYKEVSSSLANQYAMDLHNLLKEWEANKSYSTKLTKEEK